MEAGEATWQILVKSSSLVCFILSLPDAALLIAGHTLYCRMAEVAYGVVASIIFTHPS